MSRLIAFGDSFTYGHGLSDCHIPPGKPGKSPSKFAWPDLLGNMLGIETVNKAKPGAANVEILRDILTSEILPDDIVIVGWTFVLRDMIFSKDIFGSDNSIRLNVAHKNLKLVKNWLATHNDYDLSVRAGLYAHHADCYLQTKNVSQYHFCAIPIEYEVFPHFIVKPKHYIDGMIISMTDLALDNSHPGPKSQQIAAKKLYEVVNAPT